jgi:RNA polymerase II transcription elongation factor
MPQAVLCPKRYTRIRATMEVKNPEPERGARYPIVLGSTLKDEKNEPDSEFVLVQYNFQPNTISRATKGCLSLEHHRTSDKGDASHAKVRMYLEIAL